MLLTDSSKACKESDGWIMAPKKKPAFRPGPKTAMTDLPVVPISPQKKNLGAIKSMAVDSADVERIASMEPTALKEHLKKNSYDPKVHRAIVDRHAEIQGAKPKSAKPSVLRDKETGRALPRVPATPTPADTAPRDGRILPGTDIRPATNTELRKGTVSKKVGGARRRKKQTPIAVPKIGQAGSLNGKIVRVTEENQGAVYDQKRTSILPTAGRDVMEPAERPTTEPVIMPGRLRGSQSGKNLGGFAGKFADVHESVHTALGHLDTIANTARHTSEHHNAHEAYNLEHAKIGQIGNKALHKDMALARTGVMAVHGTEKMPNVLKVARGVILGRLEEGRQAAEARKSRSGKGNNNGS